MKRRLRSIIGLLALCVAGIYSFQAYWLYGTYQVATAQFRALAHEALQAVVQRQQVASANQVFRLQLPDKPSQAVVGQVRRRIKKGSHVIVFAKSLSEDDKNLVGPSLRLPPVASIKSITVRRGAQGFKLAPGAVDSLAHQLSYLVVNGWAAHQAPNLPQLAAAYRAELRQRGADLPFQLDTVARVPGPQSTPAGGRAGFTVRTPAVALNPVRQQFVAAAFRPPVGFVLRGMAGSLAGSVLLLALTTGCFGLMLSTILRQKKLSEVKSDFINNMTHELKTPLATVSAAVEALQDFGALRDPHKTDTYLTLARQELRRLADLIEKVLRSAAEERHGLAVHPERVHPAALVADVVRRHQLHAPKPVQFALDIPAADTQLLDAVHFAGVVNNLIDNAIKYSGAQVAITIRAQAAAGGWQLTVADDGLGIAPAYQAAVFDQFFRVPTGNLHSVKGFGLGLYYVHQVVAAHGGHVAVRSVPGTGSTFSIWLPST